MPSGVSTATAAHPTSPGLSRAKQQGITPSQVSPPTTQHFASSAGGEAMTVQSSVHSNSQRIVRLDEGAQTCLQCLWIVSSGAS